MQVDVDAGAAPLGDGEDRVEMAVDVAVDPRRVEPAHQIGAVGDRGIEQLGRARRGEDAALGKGHQLDVDQSPVTLAQFDERVQAGKADRRIDIEIVSQSAGHTCEHAFTGRSIQSVSQFHAHSTQRQALGLHPMVYSLRESFEYQRGVSRISSSPTMWIFLSWSETITAGSR